MALSGTTDDDGTLLHESLLPGDYMLTLTVEQELPGEAPTEENYEIPAVVLAPAAPAVPGVAAPGEPLAQNRRVHQRALRACRCSASSTECEVRRLASRLAIAASCPS